MVYDGHAKTKSAVPFSTLPTLIKGCMSRLCLYTVSVACVSTGQGEGALAVQCSGPLAPWINADCLGMTWSSGPHKESWGNAGLHGAAGEGSRG